MEPNVKRISQEQVQLTDEQGQVIGVISAPIEAEVLGPGREKVYLARRDQRTPHAA